MPLEAPHLTPRLLFAGIIPLKSFRKPCARHRIDRIGLRESPSRSARNLVSRDHVILLDRVFDSVNPSANVRRTPR
jgi:hypothetical protein